MAKQSVPQPHHAKTSTTPTSQAEQSSEKPQPEPEEPPVAVVFRKDRGKDGDVFALMPELPSDIDGYYCTSYQHVGQHSGADYQGCIAASVPATPAEYEDLKQELTGRGYNLRVVQRATPEMHEQRRKDARAPHPATSEEAPAVALPADPGLSGSGGAQKTKTKGK